MRGELHYTLTQVDGVAARVGVTSCTLTPRYNIAPGQLAPVVIVRDSDRACESLRWGLLPRWRGHGGTRGPLVHAAPVEAIGGAPLLRDAFKNQRCLVIADGCFAWSELKQPIWFHPEPCEPIAFAGVWTVNPDDEQPSFALLLGPSLVTRVNDPMPIALAVEAYDAWLDPAVKPEHAIELVVGPPSPLIGWRADLVSTRMTSKTIDDPQCVTPLGNPNQRELF
jgi:putative SOS response-associated peptidase YedK